jgi:2-hydroxy-6-oxonona-2,4-dienedioate hydrolase
MSLWPELASGEYRLHHVNAGGLKTRCLEAGAGAEAVLFLHGSGGHLEAYTRNILPHAARYKVYAIDMIGHGYTEKPNRPYQMDDYVDHILAFMDAVGLERAHISGESLGGWAAAWLAAKHPARIGKLVLNTAGGLTANPEVMERLKTLSMNAVRSPDREAVKKRLEWLMHDKSHVSEDLVDMRFAIYTQPGFVQAMEHIMCLQEMSIRKRNMLTDDMLRAIRAKTLVVWTDHDPTGAVEVGERFANSIAGARMVVMKGCGHWPQFEDAPTFNRLHLDFLAS